MGPGTAVVEVEGVAVFLWRELGVGRGGDEVAEFARFPAELTIGVRMFVDWGLRRRLAVISHSQSWMPRTVSGILRKQNNEKRSNLD